MTPIIGLIGLARSGKSTAAEALASTGYQRIRFADPLKDMLRAIGLTEYEIEGAGKERPCALLLGKTPRHAMQTLGTEWGRGLIGPRFWTGLWSSRAAEVLNLGGRVVAEDVRFPQEAESVRRGGGLLIRITRPGLVAGCHASEAEQAAIVADIEVVNDGDVEDLRRAVLDAAVMP